MDDNDIYQDEKFIDRFKRKTIESPFMVIGLTGMLGICGYGAYSYKNRGNMRPSIFLMRLRVMAQGTVIGSLTVGLMYNILDKHVFKKNQGN